ncbi:MAG: RNA polymerase sigma factor [Blastocatellia bacterium]
MTTHPDDLALVERIVGGDEEAAEAFGRQYQKRFAYLARRAGVPRQDCEDVAQEVWLAAIGQMQRGKFHGESGLGTWLDGITQHKIADYWRSRARADRFAPITSPDQTDDATASGELVEAVPQNLESEVEVHLVLQVREALKRMPPPERALLLLKLLEGYTIEEISRATGLTVNQVGGRLFRAEERFRRLLRGETTGRRRAASPRRLKKGDQASEQ